MAINGAKKNGVLPWTIGVALLLLAAVVVAIVLTRGRDAEIVEPGDPYNEPYARMHDPEYLKQIDKLRDEQKEIAGRLVAARAALDAAKEKGEDSPEYKAAAENMEAVKQDFARNRTNAERLVRDRIMRENDAIKAKQESLKQKGE